MKIYPHTFFVMDIYLAYSWLLRRPWIHSIRAITSTLHQRLKFLVNNKLVIVEGEEDIMVSHLTLLRYVEGGDEVQEISFQSLEIVNVEMSGSIGEVKTTEFPMASLKDAQTIIKNGHPEVWGRMLELLVNKDRAGLGYNSQNLRKQTLIAIEG